MRAAPHVLRAAIMGACSTLLLLGRAEQASALSLATNNPLLEHRLSPGQTAQGTVEVSNDAATPAIVSVYLEDWRYTQVGDGSKEFAPPRTLPRSAADWISFSPTRLEIPAHGRSQIEYTIRTPSDRPLDGGYYAVLFMESGIGHGRQQDNPEAIAVEIEYAARIGSLFLLEVNGTTKPQARLASLVATPPSAGRPLTVEGTFVNEGNVVARCEAGSFHIQDASGILAARGGLPDRYVWPGDQVPFLAQWEGSLAPGSYNMVLSYDCGDELVVGEEVPLSVP